MTRTVVIDPVTRIEGELSLELSVDETSGTVSSAKATGSLFRGFENIVLNRDPRDAAPILSAICGVCYCDHHVDSVRALEHAAGMTATPRTTPPNRRLSRGTLSWRGTW